MACEIASQKYADVLTAWVKVEKELTPLVLSYVGTPGHPGDTIIPGSEKYKRVERLMSERDEAWERYRAAESSFFELKRVHRR